MVHTLTVENIKLIYHQLEKEFPLMLKGIQKPGLIEAAIERQTRILYGQPNPYANVYEKAASLMEAISRWHIFYDGNKRTGLLSAFLFLYINEHYLAIPIDAVRFTQKIAATIGEDQETIDSIIKETAEWLRKYTTTEVTEFSGKVLKYTLWPALKLWLLNFFGFKRYVQKKLDYLFAVDMHPEYKQEREQVYSFLMELMKESFLQILESRKAHPKQYKFSKLDPMKCAVSEHDISLYEEDRLYDSKPDTNGLRQIKTKCFNCGKSLLATIYPQNEEEYLLSEL